MAAAPLLTLQNIRLTLGSTLLLEDAELSVLPGDKLALVGRNGSGKSTLLKIAAGEIEPDGGRRFLQPGATIRYLPQEPDLTGYATTLDYAAAGLEAGNDPHRARYLLEHLGLTGSEDPARLSGGEARRAALARVLAPEPDIVLLDEPTNHLDLPAIEWLEAELANLRSALVIISHDRRFLSDLTRATIWLDRGVTRRLNKGFSAFEDWRDTVLEEEATARHKLDRQIVREEHWLTYGVTARRKRNVRRLEGLHTLRRERRELKRQVGAVRLSVAEADMSGKLVLEAERISKRFGERPIVTDFSTRILRGDRVGVIGANGAGKTTLLRLLTGELAPDSGRVRLGANLEIATLDQRRRSLDPSATLKEALTAGGSDTLIINGQPKHVVGYMKDFLFTPEQARTAVEKLSGGERGRLALARALALPSNLLVLDEPTNDLDLETLDLLQEMLGDYPGTVIVVSHDRDFLDRVATSVIVAEGEGKWTEYAGGYSDMVAQRGFGVTKPELEKAPKAERAATAPAAPPPTRAKLSFKQKHALETLPKDIARLAGEIERLQAQLADPGFYGRDPKDFAAASAKLTTAEAAKAKAEDDWLELEMLREEIEG
ncbi:MAG: elongation factor 3 [Devosia sp. 67-54]|mgnify:CR=1 FL=1|uniref:ABC-F family ATP-binding cassette domain-containing protein n=1 Tax=unclassified Devosia TaxID=196773 RepID=UPI000961A38E|nr:MULTISPECIES: ABC-F family ATP-binding cassette domain-containing protein [unclassified Devosia]MBN9304591.1 ABC-F family ATP-binding cassette domain-containing protein [Devosia sp.]OJX15420.1 MAG: elongation factor 3 [Devosia sp. 67-54]